MRQRRSHPGCSCPADRVNQFASQVRFLFLRLSGSCLLSPQSQHSEYGRVGQLDSQLCRWVTTMAAGMRRGVRNFGRRPMYRHRSFPRTLLCTSQCLLAATSPPLRPHISFAILTQADRCSMRTVAQCEVALFPVAGTSRLGSRVI